MASQGEALLPWMLANRGNEAGGTDGHASLGARSGIACVFVPCPGDSRGARFCAFSDRSVQMNNRWSEGSEPALVHRWSALLPHDECGFYFVHYGRDGFRPERMQTNYA